MVQGLPSDLDSEIEPVRTGREAGAGAMPDHGPAVEGAVAVPARRKVRKDARGESSGRNSALPWTSCCCAAATASSRWDLSLAVCHGRSQLSLKHQFLNNVSK